MTKLKKFLALSNLLGLDTYEDRFFKERNLIVNFNSRFWLYRFYTLMVLSTALFGKPAFRNLICNGLVLAEDGKKMSKKLKNYPSPVEVINDYGAVSF